MEKFDEPGRAMLLWIAAALSVPVERFFTDKPSAEVVASEDECLRLWSLIKTEDGRRQALEALRAIVELEKASCPADHKGE